MPDRSKTRPRDANELAHRVFAARAAALSPKKRSQIAAKAAKKRWGPKSS